MHLDLTDALYETRKSTDSNKEEDSKMERAEREAVSAYAEAQTWFVIANTDSASPRGFALRKSKSFFAPTGVDVESDEFRAVVSDAAERALEEYR